MESYSLVADTLEMHDHLLQSENDILELMANILQDEEEVNVSQYMFDESLFVQVDNSATSTTIEPCSRPVSIMDALTASHSPVKYNNCTPSTLTANQSLTTTFIPFTNVTKKSKKRRRQTTAEEDVCHSTKKKKRRLGFQLFTHVHVDQQQAEKEAATTTDQQQQQQEEEEQDITRIVSVKPIEGHNTALIVLNRVTHSTEKIVVLFNTQRVKIVSVHNSQVICQVPPKKHSIAVTVQVSVDGGRSYSIPSESSLYYYQNYIQTETS